MSQAIISCSDAVRRLWDYLDRDLSRQDAGSVQRHLAFCRTCCGEMEFARELQGFLASAAEEDVPPEALDRLERFLDEL